MDGHGVELRRAEPSTLSAVESLLSATDLPTDDVRDGATTFYLASLDGQRVGVGGLETHGTVGLLRSVAVDESCRGEGIGTAICDHLEERARASGVETLYLLTTGARAFFAERGYETLERSTVPECIAVTSQFAELCPDSATCMRKHL